MPLRPGLFAFPGGSFCWTVEFYQDRRLPPGLGFSVLSTLHSWVTPGTGIWGAGVMEKKKGGSATEVLCLHQYTCPAGSGIGSELEGVILDSVFFFS